MTVAETIRTIRETTGLNQSDLAEALGISQTSISQLESGQIRTISPKVAGRIKNILGITIITLPNGEISALSEKVEDSAFLETLRKFSETPTAEGTAGLRAKEPSSRYEGRPISKSGSFHDIIVPLYSTVVHAGKTAPIYEEDKTDFNVSQHYKDTAIYHVSGDSMIDAGIEESDRVVVKLGYRFRNRDIILCRYNGELQIKGAAIIDGVIWLFPANEHYHAWACKDGDEFTCIGTVIEIFKDPHTEWWKRIDFKSLKG